MQGNLSPIMRDFLIRFQQTAIKETGRRPLTFSRTPMDDKLVLPGCQRPGYIFWQPIAWKDNQAPLGENALLFHQSIIDYVSMCQLLEIRFHLPVAPLNSPLSFLYGRVFETCKNTDSAPPSRAFDEAVLYHREHPDLPLGYTMAVSCDGGSPLLVMLRAEDGQMFIQRTDRDALPVFCKLTIDRLLPKLQFVYDF
ncbi:MAG TPA: hypothetical protein PLP25_11685 [Candidatus Limiplasma sp.]|nr:hypothetical protein [Candidatus Limiplasma sp.]HPS82507.1 hypothetical protein [Candidatus Limiplasma sp.]